MKFKKINTNWNLSPNLNELNYSLEEDHLEIIFQLDNENYEHIDKGEQGKLTFEGVHIYTEQSINNLKSELSSQNITSGVYKITNSNWKGNFPNNSTRIDTNTKKNQLSHYLVLSPTKSLQVIAQDVKFEFLNDIWEKAYSIYPKGYLYHFLTMFANHFKIASKENYHTFIELYIQVESVEELLEVKKEIKQIRKDGNLSLFLKLMNNYNLQNFKMKQLNQFLAVTQSFKI